MAQRCASPSSRSSAQLLHTPPSCFLRSGRAVTPDDTRRGADVSEVHRSSRDHTVLLHQISYVPGRAGPGVGRPDRANALRSYAMVGTLQACSSCGDQPFAFASPSGKAICISSRQSKLTVCALCTPIRSVSHATSLACSAHLHRFQLPFGPMMRTASTTAVG